MALRKTYLRNEHLSSSLTVIGCQDGGVNIQVTFFLKTVQTDVYLAFLNENDVQNIQVTFFLKTVQTDVYLAFLNENDVLQIKVVVSAIFCVKYP